MTNHKNEILITQREIDDFQKKSGLRKAFSGIHLWGVGVGTVIAGTFFGWNYGVELSGAFGFIIATLIVSVFYILLTKVFAELSTMLPYAGGPYAYGRKGLGTFFGYLTGVTTIMEFMCAAAAITISISLYFSKLYPTISHIHIIAFIYILFIIIDIIGIKQSGVFQLIITGVAISALVLFFLGTSGSASIVTLTSQPMFINGLDGIFAAIPFAMWFYICIEGISLAAEETKNPHVNIGHGFKFSIGTVVLLNIGILIIAFATVPMQYFINTDSPLTSILMKVQPNDKVAIVVFSTLALCGLLASLHGVINGFSREVFSLSRAGYLPQILSSLHPVTRTPYLAIILSGLMGVALPLMADVKTLVFLASFFALLMYFLVILSYIKIKTTEGDKIKSFSMKLWLGFLLIIATTLLVIMILMLVKQSQYIMYAVVFFSITGFYYFMIGSKHIMPDAPEEIEAKVEKISIY